MKKNVSKLKLKLHLESLRILDGTNVSGAVSGMATCGPSCPATCGVNPDTTTQLAAAAFSAPACCV